MRTADWDRKGHHRQSPSVPAVPREFFLLDRVPDRSNDAMACRTARVIFAEVNSISLRGTTARGTGSVEYARRGRAITASHLLPPTRLSEVQIGTPWTIRGTWYGRFLVSTTAYSSIYVPEQRFEKRYAIPDIRSRETLQRLHGAVVRHGDALREVSAAHGAVPIPAGGSFPELIEAERGPS
jgi:hypothetical protein